jgi:flagellar basal-body rod protein FlgB
MGGERGGKVLPPAAVPLLCSRAAGRHIRDAPRIFRAAFRVFDLGTPLATANPKRFRMFDNIFGIHEKALLLQGQRVGILATNLANADTPNYKARDIDFSAVLAHSDSAPLPLSTTESAHIALNDGASPAADLKYRNPYQASLDGNTVEMPVEQAAFAENNVRYQASLNFINLRIAELTLAINGQ